MKLALLAVCVPIAACRAPVGHAQTEPVVVPAEATATRWPTQDPAFLRREILRRMDARIRQVATELHLQARLVLDEVIPIPYLGVDAEPAPGGMRVTAVYGGTGAEAAGLAIGDLLVAIDDVATNSRPALANAIRGRRPDTEVTLHIQRHGKAQALLCKLGMRPEEDEDEAEQFPDLPGRPAPATKPFAEDFQAATVGEPTKRLETVLGGHGETPRWIVQGENGARFLRQESMDRTGIHFPMALAKDFDCDNVVARVRLRYSGGQVDRAGGIVLRYLDAGNYLVARVNAAEGDLRIFRSANGIRRTLPGGIAKGATDDHQWHTLEFRAEGSKLTATLDGTITVTAYDSMFLRGRCGVWTKSDSVTDFDDLSFEPILRK